MTDTSESDSHDVIAREARSLVAQATQNGPAVGLDTTPHLSPPPPPSWPRVAAMSGATAAGLVWLAWNFVLFPTANVRGLVLDLQGKPVIGARISIEDTSLAVASGADGRFLFNSIPSGQHWLLVELGDQSGVALRRDFRPYQTLDIGAVRLFRKD
jgi:hypothetical protein